MLETFRKKTTFENAYDSTNDHVIYRVHSLEKYLNLEGFLEMSLKIKYALKSLWILFSVGLNTVDRDLNQYKIVVPLFGAANAAPNKGTTILY